MMWKFIKHQWLLFLKDLGLRCHKCGGRQIRIDYFYSCCDTCGELFCWEY